jgi:hypothetical protein
MTTQRDWHSYVRDYAFDRRLIGCPLSVDEALATADIPNATLIAWCRESLAAGVMLRTSQAEHIAAGRSLAETARITLGFTGERGAVAVLTQLTRLEEDEAAITDFYFEDGSA